MCFQFNSENSKQMCVQSYTRLHRLGYKSHVLSYLEHSFNVFQPKSFYYSLSTLHYTSQCLIRDESV